MGKDLDNGFYRDIHLGMGNVDNYSNIKYKRNRVPDCFAIMKAID